MLKCLVFEQKLITYQYVITYSVNYVIQKELNEKSLPIFFQEQYYVPKPSHNLLVGNFSCITICYGGHGGHLMAMIKVKLSNYYKQILNMDVLNFTVMIVIRCVLKCHRFKPVS